MRQTSTGLVVLLLFVMSGIVYTGVPLPAASHVADQPDTQKPNLSPRRHHLLPELGAQTGELAAHLQSLLQPLCTEQHKCTVDGMIATMPDPVDSHAGWMFDRDLDALQRALEKNGYLLDRYFLPWEEARGAEARCADPKANDRQPCLDLKAHVQRTQPGILVFRKNTDVVGDWSDVLLLFLVGETPTFGVQPAALETVLSGFDGFKPETDLRQPDQASWRFVRSGTIRILGPTFSGSARSLRVALDQYPDQRFRIISGSATADSNAEILRADADGQPGRITFQATVIPDSQLTAAFFRYLTDLRVDPAHVALLSEANTRYGQYVNERYGRQGRQAAVPRTIPFPMHISQVRSAFDGADQGRQQQADDIVQVPQTTLQLSLGDLDGEPPDVVPAFAPRIASPVDQLVLAQEIVALAHEHFEFVGILATDPRDKLFLGRMVRTLVPSARLFTFGSDVLYAHPTYVPYFHGSLIVTTYPLYDENQEWTGAPEGQRLQFADESAEGMYNAALALLAGDGERGNNRYRPLDYADPLPAGAAAKPSVWLTTVTATGLVPLVTFDWRDASGYVISAAAPHAEASAHEVPIVWAALYLLMAVASVSTAFLAFAGARFRDQGTGFLTPLVEMLSLAPADQRRGERMVLLILLQITELASFGYWSYVFIVGDLARYRMGACVVTTVVVSWGVFVILVAVIAAIRARFNLQARRMPIASPGGVGPAIAALVLLVGIGVAVRARALDAFVPSFSNARLLFERGTQVGGGVSPALPVLLLGLVALSCLVCELRRVRLSQVYGLPNPLTAGNGTSGVGIETSQQSVASMLEEFTVQPLLISALLVALTIAFLKSTVPNFLQTFEGYGWDVVFQATMVAIAIGLLSVFFRFCLGAYNLRRLLRRLAMHPMVEAYDRLPAKFSSKLRSRFYAYLPNLSELELPLEMLGNEEIEAKYMEEATQAPSRGWLRGPYGSDTQRQLSTLAREVVTTWLNPFWNTLDRAQRAQMAARHRWVAAENFVALQVATHLGYLFAQLWNLASCVIIGSILFLLTFASYPFQGRELLMTISWVVVLGFASVMAIVVIQMDRSELLTRLGNPKAKADPSTFNRVTLDRNLIGMLVTYVVVPVLALLATQFPRIGGIFHLIDPLLRGLR